MSRTEDSRTPSPFPGCPSGRYRQCPTRTDAEERKPVWTSLLSPLSGHLSVRWDTVEDSRELETGVRIGWNSGEGRDGVDPGLSLQDLDGLSVTLESVQ